MDKISNRGMGFLSNYSLNLKIVIYIISVIVLGNLIISSPFAAGFLTFVLVLLLFVLKSPLKALSIFIIIVPFTKTSLLRENLINMPGTKPVLLLAIFVVIIAIINYRQSIKMPRYSLLLTISLLTIFSICIMRSLPNLDTINMFQEENLSISGYILSDYVKPLSYFIPFIIVIKFTKGINHLEYLINMMVLSLVVFSLYLLYVCLFKIGDKGVRYATGYYALTFGMHRNSLATFCIVGFPFLLARYYLKKNIMNVLCICVSIGAVGFLYSRSAYATILLSLILYLFISKRAKFLPVFLVFAFVLSFFISASIIERASKGMESGDIDEISAGRLESIWLPLIDEYMHNPMKTLFGNGRHALLSSNAAARGVLLKDNKSPHNMYLEQVLDNGIFGLMIFMLFFIVLFKKAFKSLSRIRDVKLKEYQYAVIVSMISYFVSGMTGRSLYPQLTSCTFWITVGFAIVIMRMRQESGQNTNAEA